MRRATCVLQSIVEPKRPRTTLLFLTEGAENDAHIPSSPGACASSHGWPRGQCLGSPFEFQCDIQSQRALPSRRGRSPRDPDARQFTACLAGKGALFLPSSHGPET